MGHLKKGHIMTADEVSILGSCNPNENQVRVTQVTLLSPQASKLLSKSNSDGLLIGIASIGYALIYVLWVAECVSFLGIMINSSYTR